VYPHSYFEAFNPAQEFEKWASVEVSDFEHIPANMETFVLPGGLYAVFEHKGSGYDNSIFQFIYGTWLPASEYLLDERPHFEVLGEKYKNNDPDSEEEIWIPIKLK
jgi:AraC family transcriptional regulator